MVLTSFKPAKVLLHQLQCNLMGNRKRTITSKNLKNKRWDLFLPFRVQEKIWQEIPWCKNSKMEWTDKAFNLTASIPLNLSVLTKLKWDNLFASSEALTNSADGKNSNPTWNGARVTFGRMASMFLKMMKCFNTSMSFWTTITQRDGNKASIALLTSNSLQLRQVATT